jgi:hypothetical protein
MSSEPEADRALDPEPTTAEREAVRLALARLQDADADLLGSPGLPAWHAAGLQESVDREPQDAAPRSSRGATRA